MPHNKPGKYNFKKVMQSILSALLGVQSHKNMEQDFTTGKFHHYIITGVIVFIVILFILYLIVAAVI